MGDIEKFFNENFFKKTRSNEVFKQDNKFNGVPESHFEPTFKSPTWQNQVGRTGKPTEIKNSETTTESDFSLGSLSGIGRFPPETTSPKGQTSKFFRNKIDLLL